MNKAGFLVLSAVVSLGAFVLSGAGCSSSNTGTGGAGGMAASTSTSVSTSTTSSSSASTSGSSSSSGGAVKLDCTTYCGTVMANCSDPAKTQQYATPASCMAACAAFTPGALADTSGDTLGCRIYHAGAAKMDAALHCEHAGPTGGDRDVTDALPATPGCGEGCEAFCAIQAKACTGANQAYADIPTCLADCKKAPKDVAAYSVADTATNDFGCRMYHLSVAATDAASAGMHCAHIKATKGTPCNP